MKCSNARTVQTEDTTGVITFWLTVPVPLHNLVLDTLHRYTIGAKRYEPASLCQTAAGS